VLLTTITDPAGARAGELASAYHQRWEEETAAHRDRLLCDSGGHQSLPLRRHNSDLREVDGLVTT
jgi:hypothetical protein